MGDGSAPTRVTAFAGLTVAQDLVTRAQTRMRDRRTSMGLVLGAILLYAIGLLAFRHHNIVRTNREYLRAQLRNLQTRIPFESDPDRSSASDVLMHRIDSISVDLQARQSRFEWLFWSRGRELAAWAQLHEVERQVIAFLVPEARIIERATTAEAELRVLRNPSAIVLADRIHVTLGEILSSGRTADHTKAPHALEHLKQQLAEGLTLLYDEGDTRFAGLMEWHNKSMWLVYLSLLMIATLSLVLGHEELFLIGASGGLMSRMTRTLFREDVPSDYGASWTTLFLSPLLGAISGWFGIALITWLTAMDVLGVTFARFHWDGETDALIIGMAFTLGFSERLFRSLLSAVEGRVDRDLKESGRVVGAPPVPFRAPVKDPDAVDEGEEDSATDKVLKELDLTKRERAAFIGGPDSAVRHGIAAIVGAENVFDITAAELEEKAPLDALFVDVTHVAALGRVTLEILAGQLGAVRPQGRIVVFGRTSKALYTLDAAALSQRGELGPALVRELLTQGDPDAMTPQAPIVLSDGDPIEWVMSFVKSS